MYTIDLWNIHTVIGAFIIACILPWRVTQLPPVIRVIWSYFAIQTLLTGFNPWEIFEPLPEATVNIGMAGAQNYALVLLVPMLVMYMKDTRLLLRPIRWILIIDAALICFGFWGIFMGVTMDTTMLALFLPTFVTNLWAIPIFLFAIARTKSSTAFVVLGLIYGGLALANIRKNKVFAYPVLTVIAIGVWWKRHSLLEGSGRLQMWSTAMDWWNEAGRHVLGAGSGSFEWVGTLVKIRPTGKGVLTLHNDWLQILFEQGIIGLTLALIVFVMLLCKAKGILRFWILGFGGAMMFYSPLHYFTGQVLAVALIKEVYARK